jgi:hypothetical protein
VDLDELHPEVTASCDAILESLLQGRTSVHQDGRVTLPAVASRPAGVELSDRARRASTGTTRSVSEGMDEADESGGELVRVVVTPPVFDLVGCEGGEQHVGAQGRVGGACGLELRTAPVASVPDQRKQVT